MNDLISRQAAIDALNEKCLMPVWCKVLVKKMLTDLPSAEPEIKPIEYRDCANAMLRMWMDKVVTDGEYNRIMAKLTVHWGKDEDEIN